MTIPALIMLFKMKKAQIDEDGTFYIDDEKLFLGTVLDTENSPMVKVSIQKQKHSFYPIVEYLMKRHLVKEESPLYIYSVTHDGWYILQTALSRLLSFLFSSILVPIAVSAITTIVALWINGLFQGIIPAQ